ncbi:pleckstrin homology domain-containing family A member 4 isoform X3 [Mastomys coucha]|uniref:pleckstrin homology domain-containing family A member 4 isoform X3 n=1 Tax=Mastomys coucha TaxID=35658 RepID=UPI0012620A02|nr:pleckstrin homology domain-containing family A member 4 isoform X3 [Mastomys coucha]
MEQGRPRSSLSLASSASTVSSLSSLSTTKKPTRAVHKVHAFGKRNNALRRDPNLPVHIRGWLNKQDSSGLRLWKRRWFVLSGHCLFYYKDSREESVLGSVLLPSYSVRPDGPGAPRGRRFTFTAEHPGMRTYVLAADTLEDLRGWLRALGRASRAEGEECGLPKSPARPRPGEGPGGPGGPPEVSRKEEGRISESPEVDWLSRGLGRHEVHTPNSTADLQPDTWSRRTRSPELFSPLSRPPSPLSLPRPRSAPARRPPVSAGDITFPARPHTPLSRIDVRPPLDWGPQKQTLSRLSIPRRGPSSEAGGERPPRSPRPRTPEHRTQSTQASSASSTYLQLPPRPPGTQASMILLPGPPVDSTLHQSLETDTLLTKLCGQDRLLRQLQEDLDKRQEEKEQLEAALELTRQQLGQATREAAASGKAWGRQRLLQDRLVNVRAALCHLAQDRASAQQQLWMVEDTLAGLGGPQKQPPHTEPKSPSPAPQGEESSERESLSESLELSSPQSPEVDWGRPLGGDRALSSPQSGVGSPKVSRASSPECRQPSSPPLRTKAPQVRPRMSAQEQLERMRRNQACGLPLSRSTSPRLLTLGRTLSPAPRQPDMEQRPIVGASKWLRSSGSWSSPRHSTTCSPVSGGHRDRVLSLSQALATEASQWHRLMTASPGRNSDIRGDCLQPSPQTPSEELPQVTLSPASHKATTATTGFSCQGSGRGLAAWEARWDPGKAPPALAQEEGAWPLRVTLLQSSF